MSSVSMSQRDGAMIGPGRGHGLPMYARNSIPVPRGIVKGYSAAHSGVVVRAILNHFQQA